MGASQARHFYMPSQLVRRQLTIVGGIFAAVLVLMVMVSDPEFTGAVLLLGLGLLGLSLAIVWMLIRFTRLTISDEGVTYRAVGYSVVANWDDIVEISTQRLHNQGEVDGLLLREAGLRANGCLMFLSMFSYTASLAYGEQQHFLPISTVLSDAWWYSPFADALREWAPHLFETPESAGSTSRLPVFGR